jgi:hypothetical protein
VADFKLLIDRITSAVDNFNKGIPGIQKQMLDEINLLTQQLNIKGDSIKITAGNIRLLDRLKSKLQSIILSPEYVSAVKQYTTSFNDVIKLQNEYFSAVQSNFTPPKLTKEIRNQAIRSVVDNLTESGISANITSKIHDLVRNSVSTGGSYNSLNNQLRDYIINNTTGEGQLLKYTKQITTDALNQFSGEYASVITSDLGFEWFRYSGSNIETSRPFCLACRDRQWFHISELPKVLKGDFQEFKDYNGKIYKKTGLPQGMVPGTDVTNFQVYRGGYNCGHQWRPGSEDLVPQNIKDRVYASLEYKNWAKLNGKQIKSPVDPKPIKPESPKPEQPKKKGTQPSKPAAVDKAIPKMNIPENASIRKLEDVEKIFMDNKDAIKPWFNNSDFNKLTIAKKSGINGETDMMGNISLSKKKADLVVQAFEKISAGQKTRLEHEKALATLWHEIWHNRNKDPMPELTPVQRNYMELGNEFVARKTLPEFFKSLGGKLSNRSLMNDRDDTGYNTWVVNYDKLIEHYGADKNGVLAYMEERMTNGTYPKTKDYLADALKNNISNKDLGKVDFKKAVEDAVYMPDLLFNKKYP